MDTFYRKNDIGVSIEYNIIGEYIYNEKKYRIYTDFVTDESNKLGIRLLVDEEVQNDFIPVLDKELVKKIIKQFNKDVLEGR